MDIKYDISHGPITDDDVTSFEVEFNLKFPQDYREFLKKYNGITRPSRYSVPYHIDDLIKWAWLTTLTGIIPNSDKVKVPKEYPDLPPLRDLYTIGFDAGTNAFVMSLQGDDYGTIYYWDELYIHDYMNPKSGLFFIASSFTEFLEKSLTYEEVEKVTSKNDNENQN